MKSTRRWFLGLGGGAALLSAALWVNQGLAANHATVIRWDIISIDPDCDSGGVQVNPGGHASAQVVKVADGVATITITGEGTFLVNSGAGNAQAVTGGGTWETFDEDDVSTGVGTYVVTGLASWASAIGETNPGHCNNININENARAGLVVLQIAYSDGSAGLLTVSCGLRGTAVKTHPSVLEGITVTKDSLDYTLPEAPASGVDANRTIFHVL